MKNKKLLLAIFAFQLSLLTSNAQSLTLERCKEMAHDNYPVIRQYDLIDKSKKLDLSNAAKAWLPGVNVTGVGMALTDFIDESAMGEIKNTMYGAAVKVNQVIYDGGQIKANRDIVRTKAEVDKKQLDVTLYAINERVEQLFFGILMIDEQMKQVGLLQDNLSISEKTVKSMMNNGLANQSDLDQVNVNQVQAEQQMVNLKSIRKAYERMLRYFIGDVPSNTAQEGELLIVKPDVAVLSDSSNSEATCDGARPELGLYASQENMLTAQRKALDTRLMPTVSAFGIAAYHNKMHPIMKDKNLMAGLMLKWNIGALYTRKNDIASLDNQRQQIAVQRETFLFNNNLQQQQSNGQIESLRELIKLDDKTVALRESILEKARKKVDLGTETINELLREVNAVSEARQQKVIHEIQLLQEINKLNTIKGL